MEPSAEYLTFKNLAYSAPPNTHCDECRKSVDTIASLGESQSICSECFEPGWYARLSAPGYLDCTEWSGPFERGDDALAYVCELYEVDEDGEPLGDDDEYETASN